MLILYLEGLSAYHYSLAWHLLVLQFLYQEGTIMNYIYDILLNFHETLYDFYDWNPSDNIINVRKIPLLKISSNQLKDIKENIVHFDDELYKRIENRTELFAGKDIKYIEYCCLFSDGSEVIAILIKNNNLQKSRLLVDEELEVLEVVTRLNEEQITYQIIKKEKRIEYKTRKEIDTEKMIRRHLKKLKEENALQQLRYLYYECFNEKEEDISKILKRLDEALEKNTDSVMDKISQFFQLIHISK